MTNKSTIFALAASFTSLLSTSAVTSITPFTGTYSETWESFANYGQGGFHSLPNPTTIMGGFAEISNNAMLIYEPGVAGFGLANSPAQVSDGAKGMGINLGGSSTTILFDFPMESFGAYWGAANGFGFTGDVSLAFSDGSTASFNFTSLSGALEWHGWSSALGISSVSYTGDFVVIDGLQANALVSVPELSSSLGLLGLALAGLGVFGRKLS
jgi:hypothetical protein